MPCSASPRSERRVEGPVVRIAVAALAWCLCTGAIDPRAPAPTPTPTPSAAQLVERNAVARGGLEAWRRIQTMVWVGHLESARTPTPSMSFVLEQKRPNKTRFEIGALNQRSMRLFDGEQGWKVGPGRDGSPLSVPYSADELNFAQQGPGIDGPLLDAAAKGSVVALEDVDEVGGRRAYRLVVRLASGERDRVWVDAETFLDLRLERISRNAAGRPAAVSVYYRDYKDFEGLQIPTTIETAAGVDAPPDRMRIERVSLNAPLDDRIFTHARARAAGRPMPSDPAQGPLH